MDTLNPSTPEPKAAPSPKEDDALVALRVFARTLLLLVAIVLGSVVLVALLAGCGALGLPGSGDAPAPGDPAAATWNDATQAGFDLVDWLLAGAAAGGAAWAAIAQTLLRRARSRLEETSRVVDYSRHRANLALAALEDGRNILVASEPLSTVGRDVANKINLAHAEVTECRDCAMKEAE